MKTKTNDPQTTRANFTSTCLTKSVTQRAPIYFAALFCFALLGSSAFAQLSGTKNIPGDYATLAAAITDLNVQGVGAGGVTLNLVAGNPQTAPAGGYVVGGAGSLVLTTTSAANQVIIQGNSNVVTASSAQVVGALNDAIFKLIGADWITITSFNMQENSLNTVVTPAASNTMTEWAVALLYVTATDGATNNTIQGNTISMNRTYANSFGIYSNVRHTATSVTTTADITAASGANSNNKVYGNTISNVNLPICFVGSTTVAFMDQGNDIGGTTAPTGNTITNWGGAASLSSYVSVSASIFGIASNNQIGINISRNSLTSAALASATTTRGILLDYTGTSPTGTFTDNINNNTVTVTNTLSSTFEMIRSQGMSTANSTATINMNSNGVLNCSTAGSFIGIVNSSVPGVLSMSSNTVRGTTASGATSAFTGVSNTGAVVTTINLNSNSIGDATAGAVTFTVASSGAFLGVSNTGGATTAALSMTGNDIRGIVHSVAGSSAHTYLQNTGTVLSQNISTNTFTNLNVNTTGTVTFVIETWSATLGTQTKTVNNNSIVTAFNRGGASGSVLLVSDNGSSVTGTVSNCQNNNFSNITVAGTSTITGINLTDGGTAPTKNVTGNTLNNWTAITGAINAVNITYLNGASSISTNTITNLTGQAAVTGMTFGSTANTANPANISSNIINTLSSTGTGGAVTGITCANTSPVINITGNTINTLSSTGAVAVSGIVVSGATSTTVSKNKICDLSGTNASTTVNGILVSSATASGAVTLSNNLVGNLTASAATNSNGIIGINITGSATTAARNVYYNTVYLSNPTSGAGFGSSGISTLASATATTSTLDLRDNVIVNTSVQNGAGLTVAYRRSVGTAGTLANYASTSNNNDFYAGTPSATNLIYSDGTSSAQTVAAYKSGAFVAGTIAPRDSASFTENPPFLSTTCANATFLHINAGTPTQLESGGIPVSGITTDFDGDTRNASTPDVGADEFAGTLLDLSPPNISYTPLGNTPSLSNRSFTNVTITDPSGVNGTSGTRPRVYYKKASDASNTFNDNTSATTGWKYVEANGSTSPFDFTIDYSLIFTGSVIVGDVIQYAVVAQDNAGTPNVGINSGTFNATPSSVALTAAAFPITGTINSYQVQGFISGTFNVGIGQTYTDLTAAVNAVNTNFLNGPVTFLLTDASYTSGPGGNTPLAFPLTINANGGSSMSNTITIKPAPGVVSTITGSVASGALLTVKANWVIIDGSNSGGTDRSLTITNTSATSPSVLLFGSTGTTPVTNDTLKNCVIINGANTSSAVVVSDATTLGNAGFFNNITIQNNNVQNAFRGILAVATASGTNGSGTLITQNVMNTAGANSIRLNPIAVQGVNGVTISNNNMGNISDANAEIPVGILLATGTDNAMVTGNTISGIVTTNTTATASVEGILVSVGAASTSINVSNNTISTLTSSGTAAGNFYAIGSFSPNTTVSNNMISGLTNSAASVTMWGVALAGASNSVVSGNTVSNMSSTNTTGGSPIGINPQGAITNVNVTGNTVSNLTTLGSSSTPTGILLSGTLDGITVQNNKVTGVINNNTGTWGVWGIRVFGGNNHIIRNNFVSNVTHDMTGGGAFSTSFGAFGMSIDAGTGHKVYHNSVNMFGLMPGTATSSLLSAAFSIVNTTSTGCDVRNNVFANTITGGTTSIAHVSTYLPVSGTSAMNLTWNNNAMFTGTTAGVHGICHVGTTYTSPPSGPTTYAGLYPAGSFVPSSTAGVSNLRSYTSTLLAANTNNDNASQASTAAAPFTSTTDLHISTGLNPTALESGGATVGLTTDIDGDTRPGPIGSVNGGATAPDLGADEFDGVPLFANDMSATAFISPANGGGVVAGASFSPQASFTNTGTASQTNVTVRYRILNAMSVEVYNNTQVIASINSGVSTPVTFASTSLAAGSYAIKAKAELAGDQVPANDEITGSISAQAPLSGSYTVGAAGNYPTLTQAVNALNALGVGGPVTLTLLDSSNTTSPANTGEVFPIQINAIPNASATNTITIKPANPNTTITGSSTSALIVLNGSDFVRIDGSSNGTSSRDLTMTNNNTGTTSAVIWLQTNVADGATNNVIKNVNLVGNSNTTTLFGVGSGGSVISTSSLGTGNNSNTYQNCNISKTQYGIYSMGASAASKNSGTIINQNLINTASPNNVSVGGILVGFEDSIQIVGNNISGMSQTSSPDVVGISAGFAHSGFSTTTTGPNEVTNAIIANNVIGSVVNSGTFSAVGIGLAAATSGTSTIANNMISGVVANGTSGDFSGGIALGGGAGSTTNVYFNSVSFSGTITGATTASQVAACLAVTASTAPTLDVRDNIFTNTQLGNTGATVRFVAVALGYSSTSGNYSGLTSNFNDLRCTGAGPGTYQVGETGGLTAGTVRTALSDWQTETGRDANSLSVDPGFVSATNLHLATSPIPPVSGAGTTIATVTTDIDGDLRQSPPDIGADEIATYTLTYTAGANGAISGTSPQTVVSGGSGTAVTAVPNVGYHFVSWDDGVLTASRTDTNVMANINATASFAINTYQLSVVATTGGTITQPPTSPVTVNHGAPTTITASANAGYTFSGWTVTAGTASIADASMISTTVTLTSGDATVQANFTLNTYQLSVVAGTGGTITQPPTSPVTVNHGAATTITAVANAGYTFSGWTVTAGTASIADASMASTTVTLTSGDATVQANFTALSASFAINDVTQAETNSGQTAFTFTVTKTGNLAATVDFQTQNGTATSGSDYVATNGTLTFGPTDTTMPVTVMVIGDTTPEPNETFTVHLSNATNGATISDADGLGTITNDDGAPTTVYVNAAWTGVPCGQDPDGAGPATSMCFDAFATIQDGVNGVATVVAPGGAHLPATGPTVIVAPGTYPEAVTVSSSMTLSGPQAGQNANTRFAAFVNGPNGPKANPAVEAVITAAATAPTSGANDTMHIMANGVTIDGFVFDGNNPSLPQGGAVVIGGINTDARTGIQTEDAAGNNFSANNALIEYNIVQNFAGDNNNNLGGGVTLINPTDVSPATSGSTITRNLVRNFGAYGILLSYNAYGDVTFNTVDMPDYPDANAGIWLYDFNNTGTPHTTNITNNSVTIGQDNFGGIWINLAYLGAININNNTVNAAANVVSGSDYNYGIYLTSIRPGTTASLNGNIVGSSGGEFDRGIALWNVGTSPTTTTVTGGTIGNAVVGMSLVDNDANFGLAGSNAAVSTTGVSIDGTTVGISVDATGSTGDTVAMEISGDTSVSGCGTGISVTGANASANIHDNPASIHDNAVGIEVNAASATITSNNLYANATGLKFSNGASATAHFNRVISTTTAIDNPNNLTLNLENNWWGCNAGPGNAGCGAVTGTGADFNPWIVLGVSASPNPIAPGGQSTVTADMTHNSDNVVPVGTLPDMAVAFTATQGTMTPTNGTITSGQATSMFTSTSNSNGSATATVDGQPATAVISVTSPTFTINNVTQAETNSGQTMFTFTVTKTGSTPFTSTVDFQTQDGTATVADNDYVMNSGTLTFGPSDTTMPVTVLVNGDTKYENDETFTVELSNPTVAGKSVAGGVVAVGTGTITNDDTAPTFAINDVTMNEGNSGPTSFVFTVTKTGSTGLSSTVNFQTMDGTATLADNDYQMNSGMLTFGPTDTMMQITVLVNGDTTVEPNETFTVELSGAVGATISDGSGLGTITNDDAAPPSVVYVDDDWTGLPNGVDPDGGGPATAIGYDAFATIQGGVNGVANPGTVIVYAGNYFENPSVSKALNIMGPNAGIPGSSNARVAEAFVRTAGAAQNAVFTVTSNNVTVNGFTLDGDDPGFTGVTLGSGEDTNTSYGVRPSGNNHIVVRDNIIKRVAIGFRGDGASQNNLITENWFDSVGFFDFGYAVSLRTNYYADVVDNLMTRVWTGLHTNNFSAAGGPATWLISTNEIHSYAAGILYWLQYGSATSATFDNNSMSAETGAVANNFGMLMVSVQNAINPTLTNNSVTGTDYGIGLTNTSTTNVITFDDTNSISGTNIAAVYLTDNLTFNPVGTTDLTTNAYTGPANAIAVTLNGGAINVASGTGVKVQNSRTSAADVSSTAVVTGTSIAGLGGKGVEVLGPMTTMNLTGVLIDGMATAAHVDATSSGANAVTLTVTNSTLSGSTAATGGALNAVGTGGMAKITITNSTLTGNSPSGAGILLQDASLTIGNTIFNTSGSGTNISALGTSLVSSLGFNLSSDGFGGFLTGTGDQVNTDPMLGPLKYNGGPTFTFAPLEGSPAIDHGKDIGPFGPGHTATGEDQRGFTRPVDDPDIANAVGGDGSDIGAVELAIGVHPSSAASRKTHGPAGDFDVSLPLSGPVGIECRGTGTATNLYTMVLLFENPVTFSGAAVTSGTGMVDSVTATSVMVAGVAETQVTINLSGVTDVQTLTVGLFDVNDGVHMGDVGVRMHLMIGDATANGAVNSSDVSFVKSRLGQPVDGTNFRADITANGGINASDVSLTKSKLP